MKPNYILGKINELIRHYDQTPTPEKSRNTEAADRLSSVILSVLSNVELCNHYLSELNASIEAKIPQSAPTIGNSATQ